MVQKIVSVGVGVAIIGVAGVWIYDRVHLIRMREEMLQRRLDLRPERQPNIAANGTAPKPTGGT